jgi:Bacterial membrane protein YfhO
MKYFSEVAKERIFVHLGFLLASLYFCHRFFGVYLPFDPDVGQNLYYIFHNDLVQADHNPFHWYYSSYFASSHAFNPIELIVSAIWNLFNFSQDLALKALWVNLLASALCLWLLCSSVYEFLRYLGRDPLGSVLGTLVICFTGFHLVSGVRQFDRTYLISFATVGPVFVLFDEICSKKTPSGWVALSGMVIGLSLLSGSDFPLFVFIPFALGLPLLHYRRDKNLKKALRSFAYLLLSVVLGLGCAAALLYPSFIFLKDTNRSGLVFYQQIFATSFREKILAVFLRDWWVNRNIPSSAIDFYLGLPVLILLCFGLFRLRRELKTNVLKVPLIQCLGFCLVAALLVLHFDSLPSWLQFPISHFYEMLSIRYPHRFFLLALLPIGYLVALGCEATFSRQKLVAAGVLCLLYGVLVWQFIVPRWSHLILDLKISFLLSQGFALLGTLLLVVFLKTSSQRIGFATALAIFFTYTFAPLQQTCFNSYLLGENRPPGLYEAGHLRWRDALGLTAHYAAAAKAVKFLLTVAPPELRDPETRRGRILEDTPPDRRTLSYFAPITGHRFMFTNVNDPASPKAMRDLYEIKTPAILDLAGVCWMVGPRPPLKYVRRESCLPEAFVAPKFKSFPDESSVLTWMRTASHQDFISTVAVNCEKQSCSDLPKGLNPDLASTLAIKEASPGLFVFDVQSDKDALVFVSTVYRFDWRATVNGHPASVLRANHAFMAIAVSAGKNVVEFTLDPYISLYSSVVSFFFYVGLASWWLYQRRLHLC